MDGRGPHVEPAVIALNNGNNAMVRLARRSGSAAVPHLQRRRRDDELQLADAKPSRMSPTCRATPSRRSTTQRRLRRHGLPAAAANLSMANLSAYRAPDGIEIDVTPPQIVGIFCETAASPYDPLPRGPTRRGRLVQRRRAPRPRRRVRPPRDARRGQAPAEARPGGRRLLPRDLRSACAADGARARVHGPQGDETTNLTVTEVTTSRASPRSTSAAAPTTWRT